MKTRGFLGAVLLSLASTALVQAQAVPPVSVSPYAHPAPPASGGQASTMTKPPTYVSGGLNPAPYSETPSEADLKKLLAPGSTASEAEKLAPRIKFDEANAGARRAAVHY